MSGVDYSDLSTGPRRLRATLSALVFDHGILRELFFRNFHRLSGRAWRSAQPSPGWLARLKERTGVRTVVNLRGYNPTVASIALEEEACRRLGLRLEHFPVHSRALPGKEKLLEIRDFLRRLDYPVLFHCKSGADRTGLMGTLYLHWMEGVPIEKTRQLRFFPYFHFRYAKTGILDFLFESYLAARRGRSMDFLTWVREEYDPEALRKRFRSRPWLDLVTDRILRRE